MTVCFVALWAQCGSLLMIRASPGKLLPKVVFDLG